MASYSLTTTASALRLSAQSQILRRPALDDANPLLDGTLKLTVGGHDFTGVILDGLSYSNTNPGGFGECAFRIAATSPFAAFTYLGHSMAKGDAVAITHGATPVTLFEGVITNDVSHAIIEDGTAYYDVTCAGLWWKASQSGDFCRTWADDDPAQWFERNTGGPWTVDQDGKLEVRFEAGQVLKGGGTHSLYYWLDSGLGDPDADITYILAVVAADVRNVSSPAATWKATVSSSDSPWGTWTVEQTWTNETVSAGTPFRCAMSAGTKAIRIALTSDDAITGTTTADRYIQLSRFAVCTDSTTTGTVTNVATGNPPLLTSTAHGLGTGDRVFLYGFTTSASINGWQTVSYNGADDFYVTGVNVTSVSDGTGTFWVAPTVDEMMVDVATATGLATSSDSETVGTAKWGVNIRPHMSRAEAIDTAAAAYSAPIDFGFWDSSEFDCFARDVITSPTYLIDSTDPGYDVNVFKNGEDTPATVKVLYKFRDTDADASVIADGTVRAVYRPSTPTWGDAGNFVQVWDDWADTMLFTAQAENIGDQILAWLDDSAYAGTIRIAAPTVPLHAGGTKTSAYIRAGETIADSNLDSGGNHTVWYITSVSVDVDSGVVELGIGETRKDFIARITPFVQGPRRSGTGRT